MPHITHPKLETLLTVANDTAISNTTTRELIKTIKYYGGFSHYHEIDYTIETVADVLSCNPNLRITQLFALRHYASHPLMMMNNSIWDLWAIADPTIFDGTLFIDLTVHAATFKFTNNTSTAYIGWLKNNYSTNGLVQTCLKLNGFDMSCF